jgi:hypothetical protein
MTERSFLNTSHQMVSWFAQQSELSQIELRPPFQRRPVWTDEQKAFLIDTILRGYPVPEIYVFMHRAQGATHDTVAIVDGQQRLRACLEFLSDGFPISFDLAKLQPLYGLADTPWFGLRFSELSTEQKQTIERYKLIVRDLEGVTDGEIRHLFHRLNQSNVVLNAQELRYSMYEGGMLATVEGLGARDEWKHFGVFTTAQTRRMLDSEFIGELVIGFLHWPQNKKDNLDHYYRQYATDFALDAQVKERFAAVLHDLMTMFERPRMGGTRWRNKSDFYTLFLALARGRIPVSDLGLSAVRDKLIRFSRIVNRKEELREDSPAGVYRAAVQRAATDRARRVRRENALVAFMEDVVSMDSDHTSPSAGFLTVDDVDPAEEEWLEDEEEDEEGEDEADSDTSDDYDA